MQTYDRNMFPQGPPKALRIAVIVWFVWPLAALAVVAWHPVMFVVMGLAWFAALGVLVPWSRRVSKRQREELAENPDGSELSSTGGQQTDEVPGGAPAIRQRLLLGAVVIGLFVSMLFVSGAAVFWLAGLAVTVAILGEVGIYRSTARRERSRARQDDTPQV